MNNTFFVRIPVREAVSIVNDAIVGGSITGECIDSYVASGPNGSCAVLIYEKHFWRAGNRLTLTVTIDDLAGHTRVHYVGGGGGEGLFRFDWGASESFERSVERSLDQYRM